MFNGSRVEIMPDGKQATIVESTNMIDGEIEYATFDKVILAAPWDLSTSSINPYLSPSDRESEHPGLVLPYRNRHITFFTSPHTLNAEYFSFPVDQLMPDRILLYSRESETDLAGLHEIAHVRDVARVSYGSHGKVTDQESLYRVLSAHEIKDELLREFVRDDDSDEEDLSWVYRYAVSNCLSFIIHNLVLSKLTKVFMYRSKQHTPSCTQTQRSRRCA